MRASLVILAVFLVVAALPLLTRRRLASAVQAGRLVLALAAASLLIVIARRGQ